MSLSKVFGFLVLWFSAMAIPTLAPEPEQAPKKADVVKHARGRKITDAVKHKALFDKHHTAARIEHLKRLPKATQAKFDCRAVPTTTGTVSWVPPVVDQGQCGSCWDFSGTSICTSAFIKAMGSAAPGPLSEQYTLDCGQNGGCNGDDNTTVTTWAKATGLPTTAQYGSYQGSAGTCKTGMTLNKITDWGYVTTGNNQSVAATQDIKNAMQAYGPIGCGVDASGGAWDSYTTGLLTGAPSTSIDHDVVLVGWDDTQGPSGVWIMRNSWGTSWGQPCGGTEAGGYAYVPYGDFGLGWEAIWATVAAPPGPAPVPPGPTPVPPAPVPPGPVSPVPVITSPLTASAVVGQSFSYQVTATGAPVVFQAAPMPSGLTCTDAGNISGTPTIAGTWTLYVNAANASGWGQQAAVALTVTLVPSSTVTITLTADQVSSVLSQDGTVAAAAAILNGRMNNKGSASVLPVSPTGKEPPLPDPRSLEMQRQLDDRKKALDDREKDLNKIADDLLKAAKPKDEVLLDRRDWLFSPAPATLTAWRN